MSKRRKKRAPGAGRPNELGDSKLVAVRLPLSLIAKLEREAAKRDVSLSELIRSRLG